MCNSWMNAVRCNNCALFILENEILGYDLCPDVLTAKRFPSAGQFEMAKDATGFERIIETHAVSPSASKIWFADVLCPRMRNPFTITILK